MEAKSPGIGENEIEIGRLPFEHLIEPGQTARIAVTSEQNMRVRDMFLEALTDAESACDIFVTGVQLARSQMIAAPVSVKWFDGSLPAETARDYQPLANCPIMFKGMQAIITIRNVGQKTSVKVKGALLGPVLPVDYSSIPAIS